MIVYLTLLFVVFILSILRRRNKKFNNTTFISILISLVSVAGLRDISVGSDSENYVLIFNKTENWEDIWGQTMEPGFLFIAWLSNLIGNNYAILFTFTAILAVSGLLIGINKYSVAPRISLFLLITSGYYTFFFNGARQGLALSITFLAIGLFHEKNFKKIFFITVFASFFHLTALILIPAYWLIKKQFSIRTLIYIFLFSLLSSLFLAQLITYSGSVDERFSKYSDFNEATGLLSATYNFVLCAFFIFMYRAIKINKSMYSTLLNFFCIGAGISTFATLNNLGASGIGRLGLYFTVSSILIWPIIFQNVKYYKDKNILLVSFISFYLAYFYLTTANFSHLAPYKINPIFLEIF